MEYLNVLDAQGNKTGIVKPRDEVHNDGSWHAVVHVWMKNSRNQVLLQKRSSNVRTYPNLWAYTIGGHVLAGEKLEQAIIREMFEELGLQISMSDIKFGFMNKNQDIENNNQLDYVYILQKDLDDLSVIKMDPMEVSEISWIDIDELKRRSQAKNPTFVPRTKEYWDKLFKILREI